jgi:hypothetical protein
LKTSLSTLNIPYFVFHRPILTFGIEGCINNHVPDRDMNGEVCDPASLKLRKGATQEKMMEAPAPEQKIHR